MKIPAYYGFWHHLGAWLLKTSSWLVLLFLILPILVIIPLSSALPATPCSRCSRSASRA